MKKAALIIFLVVIGFSYSFAQMQISIISPNKELVQWEKNDTNTENPISTQNSIKQTLVENEMINIPLDYNGEAGIFIMGEEGVTSNTFEVTFTYHFDISKYMITNQEYADMLNYALGEGLLAGNYQSNVTVKNAEGFAYELLDMDASWEGDVCQIEYLDGMFVVKDNYQNHPVIFATWFGTAFYCNMRSRMEGLTELYDQNTNPSARTFYGEDGYRLPTEHEWEYAATYNDERHYPWGNETATPDYASFNNEYAHSTPVNQYPLGVSQLGLMDMAGNVAEFTNNYVFSYTPDPQLNPTGPDDDDRISKKGNNFQADAEVIKCHWRSGWIRQYYFMSGEYHTFGTNDVSFRILRSYAAGGVGMGEVGNKTNIINNYPNPVTNYTTFIVSQEMKNNCTISIFNSFGQLVHTLQDINFSKGSNAILFDASQLAAGMYFYSLETEQGVFSNKFLKQ